MVLHTDRISATTPRKEPSMPEFVVREWKITFYDIEMQKKDNILYWRWNKKQNCFIQKQSQPLALLFGHKYASICRTNSIDWSRKFMSFSEKLTHIKLCVSIEGGFFRFWYFVIVVEVVDVVAAAATALTQMKGTKRKRKNNPTILTHSLKHTGTHWQYTKNREGPNAKHTKNQ